MASVVGMSTDSEPQVRTRPKVFALIGTTYPAGKIHGATVRRLEILSKVVYGKKAHPRLITVKQLVLAVPLHR